jgi:hypothetical protein
MTIINNIRDLREQKSLSEDAVHKAAGLTYSKFLRIQAGRGKTTQEEIDAVVKVIENLPPGTRKLAGRPFTDPARRAAVEKARAEGTSVAAAIAGTAPAAPAKAKAKAAKATPAKATPAKAGAKKASSPLGKALAGAKK